MATFKFGIIAIALLGLAHFHASFARVVHICKKSSKTLSCDNGKYIHITEAHYGRKTRGCGLSTYWYCGGHDVLDEVRQTCGSRRQTCSIYASNRAFGNGCSIGSEFLYLEYECRDLPNGVKTERLCDGMSTFVRCPQGTYIDIKDAFYGRKSSRYCQTGDIRDTACSSDASSQVRKWCQGKNLGVAQAASQLLGDPCPGITKYLEFNYECKSNTPKPTTESPVKTTPKPTTKPPFNTKRLCDRYSGFYSCPGGKVINVLNAFYGRRSTAFCTNGDTSNTNCTVDATRYAKHYAQGKSFGTASASDAFFGDPCPGISKYLEINYECVDPTPKPTTKPPFNTKRLCDRYSGFYSCPGGKVINVLSAFYGRRSTAFCTNGDTSNTNCAVDATRYAKHYAQGRSFGTASASDAFFGDPCPGISKYLEIRYECVDPAKLTTTKAPATTKKPTPAPPVPPVPTDVCGVSQVPQSRIVGGINARPGAWPWQVALYRKGEFNCGGSLINPFWIVTAAHCLERLKTTDTTSDYHVILGDHDRSVNEGTEQRRMLSKMIPHAAYDQGHTYNNDIALLKMDRPVMYSMRISPVCLPKQGQNVPVGTKCYVSGWGMTQYPSSPSNILQQGSMPVVSKQECIQRLSTSSVNDNLSISDKMLCAGNPTNSANEDLSACRGDSGGPFVCQDTNGVWSLQGAVSWGSIRCSGKDRHSVFARVSEFRNWIDDVIRYDGVLPTAAPPTSTSGSNSTAI